MSAFDLLFWCLFDTNFHADPGGTVFCMIFTVDIKVFSRD